MGDAELDAESFFAKWLDAWPALRLARLFASPGEWPRLRGRVGALFEIAEASWVLRDEGVRVHKLQWWREELQQHAAGAARHPLLVAAGAASCSPLLAAHALDQVQQPAPADATQALGRIRLLAAAASDASVDVACAQALLAGMHLLALDDALPGAFALAPLDLRARHALAGAERGAALRALVASLARAWQGELANHRDALPRSRWHGARGMRVLHQQALALIAALADGHAAPPLGWRSAFSAWRAVAGLR